jgi:uncharacterized membrane protein
MQKTKSLTIAIIFIILLSFGIAVYSYQKIEGDIVASHWDAKGNVNGYMSKFFGIFLFPFVSLGLYILFSLIPKIDPLKKNIKIFRKYYDLFVFIIILFLFYIFVLTILSNLNYNFNITTMLMPAMGILFFGIGMFMNKLKRNWFIGIRTPWTISNDIVWEKTHKLGSKIFKIIGVLFVIGLFFEKYLLWFVLAPVIISTIWLVLYSYLEHTKIKKIKKE